MITSAFSSTSLGYYEWEKCVLLSFKMNQKRTRILYIFALILGSAQTSQGFLVSARDYVCTETAHKLVTDSWSIKDHLLYLRLNHYSNTTKEVDQRLIVYDVPLDRFLNIFIPHDRHRLSLAATSTKLSDVISVSLMNSIDDSRSPSVLYFDSRVQMQSNCRQHWLYDPPNSGFCRKHSVTTNLGRILGIVNQMSFGKPVNHNYNFHRASIVLSDNFGGSTVRQVTRWNLPLIQDALTQLITASTLVLQVNHANLNPSRTDIRFLFSNKLGLFISWIPSNLDIPTSSSPNCIIMIPVKLHPTIRLCTQKYSFVSVVELDPIIYVIIPENRVIRLPHDFLIKQFRIYNNLEIDLDQLEHKPRDLFESFFQCSSISRKLKLRKPGYLGNGTRSSLNKFKVQNAESDGTPDNGTLMIEFADSEFFAENEEKNNITEAHEIKKREIGVHLGSSKACRISWYWYYIAPIGTYLIVCNCLLLVLYIVEKDYHTEVVKGSKFQKPKNARIYELFRLNKAEILQVKSSLKENK